MRGFGQIDTSGVVLNIPATYPSGITLDSMPLNSTAIMPGVSAIPCEAGQTCSYFSNVPDWVLYVGGIVALLIAAGVFKR